jgi:methylenetetrahydrofolate reductase (NADPH)
MQISCRDKNRLAIQGDILGGAAMGVSNILCLSGDGVQLGDHPQAKPVFDLDCMSLLQTGRKMRDDHMFQSGRKLTSAPKVFLGAAANPSALPFELHAQQLAKKIAAGAQFIQTQYCYDLPRLRQYISCIEDLGLLDNVFILIGVGPLRSARAAEWMRSKLPGVHIPDTVIQRMSGATDQLTEGRKICVDLVQEIREIKGVAGVHVMAYRQEEAVAEIIQRSGVLAGRQPWHPRLKPPD